MTTSQEIPAAYKSCSHRNTNVIIIPLFQDLPDLLTVQDLKALTGLSEQTIRCEINSGRLPGCRIGRRLYVPKTHLIKYVTEGGGLND